MQQEMRRKKQQLNNEECEVILNIGDDNTFADVVLETSVE